MQYVLYLLDDMITQYFFNKKWNLLNKNYSSQLLKMLSKNIRASPSEW